MLRLVQHGLIKESDIVNHGHLRPIYDNSNTKWGVLRSGSSFTELFRTSNKQVGRLLVQKLQGSVESSSLTLYLPQLQSASPQAKQTAHSKQAQLH